MDQVLEFAAKYGGSGAIGAAILYLILRMAKSGTFPEISIRFGRNGYRGSDASNGGNGNGGNGNGNGKLTKAEVAELINTHHTTCSTELYKHIDEFNRALGRIEGHLEAQRKD